MTAHHAVITMHATSPLVAPQATAALPAAHTPPIIADRGEFIDALQSLSQGHVLVRTGDAAGDCVLDGAIVYREGDGPIRAYAARCTHLGCRIDRIAGDEIVCPCHGSRFRADGSVVTGPATKPLIALRIEPDPKTGGWIARASA